MSELHPIKVDPLPQKSFLSSKKDSLFSCLVEAWPAIYPPLSGFWLLLSITIGGALLTSTTPLTTHPLLFTGLKLGFGPKCLSYILELLLD